MNSNTQHQPMFPQPEAPVRSMTGFAQVRRSTSQGELTVSFRSVNHRGLDLHFHLQADLLIFENAIRAAVKQRVARGHLEVRGGLQRAEQGQSAFNRAAVERYVAAFRQAAAELGLHQDPDLNVAFGRPEVWQDGTEAERATAALDGALEPEVMAVVEECLAAFNAQREREGAALCEELMRQAAGIEQGAGEIAAIRKSAIPLFQERLRERVRELLGQSSISEARLVEEAAMLADRSDIQEELARLAIHTGELKAMFGKGGEMGKRVDFLLQEMNRETNTILSKTSGIGETGLTITNRALAIKAHVEKIREQALNIE